MRELRELRELREAIKMSIVTSPVIMESFELEFQLFRRNQELRFFAKCSC